jgi:hypothetical protein
MKTTGITANAICPGSVSTPMIDDIVDRFCQGTEEARESFSEKNKSPRKICSNAFWPRKKSPIWSSISPLTPHAAFAVRSLMSVRGLYCARRLTDAQAFILQARISTAVENAMLADSCNVGFRLTIHAVAASLYAVSLVSERPWNRHSWNRHATSEEASLTELHQTAENCRCRHFRLHTKRTRRLVSI